VAEPGGAELAATLRRFGLEDGTAGPDGEPAASNTELVSHALRIWETARPQR
jgi:uncharacterized protein (DUF849 family)